MKAKQGGLIALGLIGFLAVSAFARTAKAAGALTFKLKGLGKLKIQLLQSRFNVSLDVLNKRNDTITFKTYIASAYLKLPGKAEWKDVGYVTLKSDSGDVKVNPGSVTTIGPAQIVIDNLALGSSIANLIMGGNLKQAFSGVVLRLDGMVHTDIAQIPLQTDFLLKDYLPFG